MLRAASIAIGGIITANSKAAARLLAGANTQQGQRLHSFDNMLNSFVFYPAGFQLLLGCNISELSFLGKE